MQLHTNLVGLNHLASCKCFFCCYLLEGTCAITLIVLNKTHKNHYQFMWFVCYEAFHYCETKVRNTFIINFASFGLWITISLHNIHTKKRMTCEDYLERIIFFLPCNYLVFDKPWYSNMCCCYFVVILQLMNGSFCRRWMRAEEEGIIICGTAFGMDWFWVNCSYVVTRDFLLLFFSQN